MPLLTPSDKGAPLVLLSLLGLGVGIGLLILRWIVVRKKTKAPGYAPRHALCRGLACFQLPLRLSPVDDGNALLAELELNDVLDPGLVLS